MWVVIELTLVAQQASPALLTGALPGLHTGAVFTGRMPFTLITECALPSLSAADRTENNNLMAVHSSHSQKTDIQVL